ncbi:twin-arginine translocase subunit TatC [Candidatus Sumerlaeota bacterium]|nr:twin-arginine translocase subunit TatC [Candidatus Sumerlaeota bacterium]
MTDSSKKKTSDQRELTLIGHLEELRMRLIICVGFFLLATVVCFFFAGPVLEIMIRPVTTMLAPPKIPVNEDGKTTTTLTLIVAPDGGVKAANNESLALTRNLTSLDVILLPHDSGGTTRTINLLQPPKQQSKIIYPSPLDPIMMLIKVALVMAILFSLIVWIWQIWLFIAPGLTEKEKGVIRPMLLSAVILFPIGAIFAYYMIFFIIKIMQQYIVPGIDILYNVSSYLKLMTTMMIVFGIIFELPLVIALLARMGIVTPAFLSHYRRHIYVGLSFAAMVITPTTDPFTMLISLVPLIILFELSVLIARPMALMRRRDEADDEVDLTPPGADAL